MVGDKFIEPSTPGWKKVRNNFENIFINSKMAVHHGLSKGTIGNSIDSM
jgi:hypothetical protein